MKDLTQEILSNICYYDYDSESGCEDTCPRYYTCQEILRKKLKEYGERS